MKSCRCLHKKAERKFFVPDAVQLDKGVAHEMEHTDRRDAAQMIALDHLREIPDYYSRLKRLEKEARAFWKRMR